MTNLAFWGKHPPDSARYAAIVLFYACHALKLCDFLIDPDLVSCPFRSNQMLIKKEKEQPMPFINVKIVGPELEIKQTTAIQRGVTSLMAEVLNKQAELTAVLVEQVERGGWAIGGKVATYAAHVDATVSEGTNTPEQKARFIAAVNDLLREVLGAGLSAIAYVVVHDVPKDSWGYDGLTQEHRAKARA
jgi:4-oxalocrotonate tautomerase